MVSDIERSGIGFYVSHGPEGKKSDWLPLQHGLQRPLQHYLRDGLARCICRDRATRDDLVKRTWVEFGSSELGPLLEFLNGLGSVWLGVRDMAGHQLLLYRCRHLAEPAPAPADAPPESGARLGLSEVERLGLCFFLSDGLEGKDSDWMQLYRLLERLIRKHIRWLLAQDDCRDEDAVDEIFQRVMLQFCMRERDRLLTVLEKLGSVGCYLRMVAKHQAWLSQQGHLLRRQHETAVAHKADEAGPIILTEAELHRILADLPFYVSPSEYGWLLEHLANPGDPGDRVPLTAVQRQRLHAVKVAVLAYQKEHGLR